MLSIALSLALLTAQSHASTDPWEWSSTFTLSAGSYTWQSQKTGCPLTAQAYADATMIVAIIPIDNTTAAALTAGESDATAAFNAAVNKSPGEALSANGGNNLVFDNSLSTSTFPLTITTAGSYGIYAQHGVSEFEHDEHYLINSAGADVEAVAAGGGEHAHGHATSCVTPTWKRPDCSCTAAGTIHCEDSARVDAAFDTLIENKCNVTCNCYNQVCQDAFFILDQHHAGCNADQLSHRVEVGFHWFEGACVRCYEKPFQNPVLATCGTSRCVKADVASNLTIVTQCVNNNQCNANNATCAAAWNNVILEHDSCCESDLPDNLGTLFHQYEESCTAGCNIPFNATYATNCADAKNTAYVRSSSSDDDDDKLKTGALVAIVVVVAVVVIAVLFGLLYFCYLKPKTIEEAQTGPVPMASVAGVVQPTAAV